MARAGAVAAYLVVLWICQGVPHRSASFVLPQGCNPRGTTCDWVSSHEKPERFLFFDSRCVESCGRVEAMGSINDNVIDAEIEGEENVPLSNIDAEPEQPEERRRIRDVFRDTLQKLAALSLEDYKWRSSVFKSVEADRLVEESLARMRGEDPSYVRPMDANPDSRGPLGTAEKNAVDWLSRVIEEEGQRAAKIARSDGELVRPIDSSDNDLELGPLGGLEKKAVDFLNSIKDSERERWLSGILRPMDMANRGPLGKAEAQAVLAIDELRRSEMLRAEQSKNQGGVVIRPKDVPGPLGDFERKILDIFEAEQKRVEDRQWNEGRLVRPKDATVKGLLGEAESAAVRTVERLTEEERLRLRNIQRYLEENRPMETDQGSLLGMAEAIIVCVLRAPELIRGLFNEVKEGLISQKVGYSEMTPFSGQGLKLPKQDSNDDANETGGDR